MRILDSRASNFDLQEFRNRHEASKIYLALPQEAPVIFWALMTLASQAESLDDAKAVLSRVKEVMEWACPVGVQMKMVSIPYGDAQVRVPK
jgi:hypothetical protein